MLIFAYICVGIVLAGILRLDAELTPDYPFVGNTTYGFISQPSMDLSISSFGGLDLSSIPGRNQCVSSSILDCSNTYDLEVILSRDRCVSSSILNYERTHICVYITIKYSHLQCIFYV
jgi:hypothetical protein